jgi:hypothetical protein
MQLQCKHSHCRDYYWQLGAAAGVQRMLGHWLQPDNVCKKLISNASTAAYCTQHDPDTATLASGCSTAAVCYSGTVSTDINASAWAAPTLLVVCDMLHTKLDKIAPSDTNPPIQGTPDAAPEGPPTSNCHQFVCLRRHVMPKPLVACTYHRCTAAVRVQQNQQEVSSEKHLPQ